MRKILSLLILFALLAGGTLSGAAWYFGKEAERRTREETIKTQSVLPGYEIAVKEYSRGVFSSTGRLSLTFPIAPEPPKEGEKAKPPLFADFSFVINHGPWPVGALGGPGGKTAKGPGAAMTVLRPAIYPDSHEDFVKLMRELPVLGETAVTTWIDFKGGGSYELVSPALVKTFTPKAPQPEPTAQQPAPPSPVTVTWRGITATGDFTPEAEQVTSKMDFPGLEVVSADGAFSMGPSRGDAMLFMHRVAQTKDVFYLGKSSAVISGMSFQASGASAPDGAQPGPKSVKIGELVMDSNSVLAAGNPAGGSLVDQQFGYKGGLTEIDGAKYGPFTLRLVMRNLDMAALLAMNRELVELQKRLAAMTPDEQALMTESAMRDLFVKYVPDFLVNAPLFEIAEFSGKTGDGDFALQASVALKNPEKKRLNLDDMLAVMNMIEARARLTMAESLMTRLAGKTLLAFSGNMEAPESPEEEAKVEAEVGGQMLQELIAKKFVAKADAGLTSEAVFSGGKLTVNGKKIDF